MDTLTFALFVVFALVVVAGLIVYSKRGGRFTGKIGPKGMEVSTQDPDKLRPEVEQTVTNGGEISGSPIKVSAASEAKVTQAADDKGKITNSGIEIK
jgi:hypothetical protein